MDRCHLGETDALKEKINHFMDAVDKIYLSIDLDGFSSEYAPGVSAASPFGFTPAFLLEMLDHIMARGQVLSCDLAEMNPLYDEEERTARLAASLIERILTAGLNIR
jgi:formiminoglutamase